MKHITISKTKPFTGKLKDGQSIDIVVGKENFHHTVRGDHLNCMSGNNNRALEALGFVKGPNRTANGSTLFLKCGVGGISGNEWWWPQGPLKAQEKLLRALFHKPTAAQIKAQAALDAKEAAKAEKARIAKEKKLGGMNVIARELIAYLGSDGKDAFGCQRRHVIKCFNILTGEDIGAHL